MSQHRAWYWSYQIDPPAVYSLKWRRLSVIFVSRLCFVSTLLACSYSTWFKNCKQKFSPELIKQFQYKHVVNVVMWMSPVWPPAPPISLFYHPGFDSPAVGVVLQGYLSSETRGNKDIIVLLNQYRTGRWKKQVGFPDFLHDRGFTSTVAECLN